MNELGVAIRRFLDIAPSVRVLVAGDCMLDAYVTGVASRISPEAPVPVVDVVRRRYVLGGAANVAANARAMGAGVSLAGVTGVDDSAVRLREQLAYAGIGADALVEEASRPTTTKTRITAAGQQIVRFDDEDASAHRAEVFGELRLRCQELIEKCDVCVLSDYAKGVVTGEFSRWVIDAAAKRGLPVVADPKSPNFERYRGAAVITPNMKEAMTAAGGPAPDFPGCFEGLLARIAPSALLVTRGEDGMSLFQGGGAAIHLPAVVNEVADVTGAGDTVVAALAVALGCGLDLPAAMTIANIAAGVAVSHAGTWAVNRDELREASQRYEHTQRMEAAPAC